MANETLNLYELRAKALTDARTINEKSVNEKRDLTQEEQNSYTKAMDDFEKFDLEIRLAKRSKEIKKAVDISQSNLPIRDLQTEKENELRTKFSSYLQYGEGSQAEKEYRALQQDSPTQAGYLVAPQTFMAELIQNLYKTLIFRQKARVLPPLVKSESLGVPTKTTNMSSAAWGSEIGAPTPDTTLAFGKREFRPHPSTAEILVSKTLIRNAAISPDQIVREELAHQFGDLMEEAYFTGDGVGKPLGIFTASADGIPTSRDISSENTTTTITFNGLINAKYSIPKTQYWPSLEWYFHPDAIKMLAKIVDSEGQYVWRTSIVQGEPDMLLSFPVNMTEFAPNTFTAGLYVGMLGSLRDGYWIVDSLTMEIQSLFELYARTNQVDYIARLETDGAPVKSECFARVKLATS